MTAKWQGDDAGRIWQASDEHQPGAPGGENQEDTTSEEQAEQAQEVRWIMQTLAGERDAFAHLFERYKNVVYTHVYYRLNHPLDAQDAVQEIFRRAYVKLETFDRSRRFRAWLLTIATNYCHDLTRRRLSLKRFAQQVTLDAVDFWVADTEGNPERLSQAHEGREQVRQAVQQLPPKYREVLVLFYWNDLSYSEIGEITGLKESTIKTRLHRAREKLLAVLEPHQDALDAL